MIHMRETRTRRGLTLARLAERTGIDVSTLSRYETGKQQPSVERGYLVARALGVSLDLLVGEGQRPDADTPVGACALPASKTPTPNPPPSGSSRVDGVKAGAR